MAGKLQRLPLSRELEIARLAERTALASFPSGRVEPEQIARQEGIRFAYASFPEDFDGVLVHEAGSFFIICNSRLHAPGSPRSRFTFAHEIGHYFLPDHRAALVAQSEHFSRTEYASDSPMEMEADLFAAHLLLPESSFRQTFSASPNPGLEAVSSVASAFGTSLTATAYRALGLEFFPAPAAVFRWDQLGAPAGRRLSDTTARLRPEYCGLADTPPPGSATAKMIANLRSGCDRTLTPAMGWFPKLTGYDPGDQDRLQEEVQSLGQFGWLTLVQGRREAPRTEKA